MDLDSFDFKPITNGLGFDKAAEKHTVKPVSAVASASKEVVIENLQQSDKKDDLNLFEKPVDWNGQGNNEDVSQSISEMLDSLPPSLDFLKEGQAPVVQAPQRDAKVHQPLERQTETSVTDELLEEVKPSPLATPILEGEGSVDVSLNNTLQKAFPQEGFRRPFFQQAVEVKEQYSPVPACLTSGILDTLVITGLTTLFLVSLVLVTGVDLLAVIMNQQATPYIWLCLAAVFSGVYVVYFFATRGFWGASLGDWAFDIQLGSVEQKGNWHYPFQVLSRILFVAMTGFVLLPILSALFRVDLGYGLCGLKLHMKNY